MGFFSGGRGWLENKYGIHFSAIYVTTATSNLSESSLSAKTEHKNINNNNNREKTWGFVCALSEMCQTHDAAAFTFNFDFKGLVIPISLLSMEIQLYFCSIIVSEISASSLAQQRGKETWKQHPFLQTVLRLLFNNTVKYVQVDNSDMFSSPRWRRGIK